MSRPTRRSHFTDEQVAAQGRMLAKLFGLPDASNITENWSIEGGLGGGLLTISLSRPIDRETAQALVNGIESTP